VLTNLDLETQLRGLRLSIQRINLEFTERLIKQIEDKLDEQTKTETKPY